jgi:hypothetical protein
MLKISQKKINGSQASGNGASSKMFRTIGTAMVMTKIAIAIRMLIFNFLLEKIEYEKRG